MIPNLLSLSRIFLIPLFLYLIFQPSPWLKFSALVVFGIASITDFLDGWSARKLNQQTEMGKFLDPLADKFLVIATMIGFLMLDPLIPAWMVVVILGRDVLITFLRYAAIKKGGSLRTSRFGKWKTAFQMISIVIIIMLFIIRASGIDVTHQFEVDNYIKIHSVLQIILSDHPYKWLIVMPYFLMLFTTVMTAWSGIRYIVSNIEILKPPYRKQGSDVK